MLPSSDRSRALGELVDDAHSHGFAYRLFEPTPDSPRGVVVLLHGVGGDEMQLADVAARLPDDVAVVLPRGPRTIAGERLGWFRVGLGSDPPEVVEDEEEDARRRTLMLLDHLDSKWATPPGRRWLAGFSQGGVLAASVALTAPDRVAGFAMACGRVLPEIDPLIPDRAALAHLKAFLVHGRDDETLPVRFAEDASARLKELGVSHRLVLVDSGHEVSAPVTDALVDGMHGMLPA